jgi:hypothetical protein
MSLFDPRLLSSFHRRSWANIRGASTVSKAGLRPADILLPTWFATPTPSKTHSAARAIQEDVEVRNSPVAVRLHILSNHAF